jgi:uncharacterized protein
MPYLIDGHNLIPHLPGINLGDIDDETQLIRELQNFASRKQSSVEVYFDRAPAARAGRKTFGRVTAVFVREGMTADTAIRRRLQHLGKQAKNWTTVSDDREVQGSAKTFLSTVLTSKKFAYLIQNAEIKYQLNHPGKPSPTLSDEDLADWMKFFSERSKTD